MAVDGNNQLWSMQPAVYNSTTLTYAPAYLLGLNGSSASSAASALATATPATGYTGTTSTDSTLLSGPTGMLVDGSGNLWVLNSDTFGTKPGNSLVEYIGIGAPVVTPASTALTNGMLGARP